LDDVVPAVSVEAHGYMATRPYRGMSGFGKARSSPDKAGTCQYCQVARVRASVAKRSTRGTGVITPLKG
jgi:hypothetical protein